MARQLARATHEVGVNVRLADVRDAQVLLLGSGEVLADVAVGIDDDRLTRALAADQVARLGERRVVEALEVHACVSVGKVGRTYGTS